MDQVKSFKVVNTSVDKTDSMQLALGKPSFVADLVPVGAPDIARQLGAFVVALAEVIDRHAGAVGLAGVSVGLAVHTAHRRPHAGAEAAALTVVGHLDAVTVGVLSAAVVGVFLVHLLALDDRAPDEDDRHDPPEVLDEAGEEGRLRFLVLHAPRL